MNTLTRLLFAYRLSTTYIPFFLFRCASSSSLIQVREVFIASSSDGEGAVGLGRGLAMLINCRKPAWENVMNAHEETRLFLVVVNQPKIQ